MRIAKDRDYVYVNWENALYVFSREDWRLVHVKWRIRMLVTILYFVVLVLAIVAMFFGDNMPSWGILAMIGALAVAGLLSRGKLP